MSRRPSYPPLDIETFLTMAAEMPVFDVRTAAEFRQGRLPGAMSLPIFDEDERAAVGTAYVQQSREEAILLGFDFLGKKMRRLTEEALSLAPKSALVYCWRGGMRSEAIAWMLNFYGIEARTLSGGYKTFRRYALESFDLPRRVVVVGGNTGSGKTAVLNALRALGEQVIDLEGIAHHKGSAFGAIGQPPQPSNEQFENELGLQWRLLNSTRRVWLEDESQKIGANFIPNQIYNAIRTAPTLILDIPTATRIENLVKDYGMAPPEQLEACILKIERRLGGYHTKLAREALHTGDFAACFGYILDYYDRTYNYGIEQRNADSFHYIPANSTSEVTAKALQQAADLRGL